MFYKYETQEVEVLKTTGPLLGPAPNAHYYIESLNFNKGDILLLFSDGITETADKKFEQFGDERLTENLLKYSKLNTKELVLTILDEVIKFSKNGLYNDDKTLVAIKKIN